MKSGTVAIGSARLSYQRQGTGRRAVLLHAGVCDSRMWRPQLEGLAAVFDMLTYDRRGFGLTECGRDPFSHVDDLAALLDALDIRQTVLVGASQGGRIAIDFVLAHPERVSALMLLAPALSGARSPDSFPSAIQRSIDALSAAEEADDLAAVNRMEVHLWLDGPAQPEGRVGGELRDLLLDMNGTALRKGDGLEEREPPAAVSRLGEIRVPTVVVWGDLDFPHAVSRAKLIAESIPGARGAEVPGTAHLPNLERPAEVNALCRTLEQMLPEAV